MTSEQLGNPATTIDFPAQTPAAASQSWRSGAGLTGVAQGPNAVAARVTATSWQETPGAQAVPRQPQYPRFVLLTSNGLSWPHVTAGMPHKQP